MKVNPKLLVLSVCGALRPAIGLKWMTLPQLSGNMSQLKCRLFPASVWIGEKANLAGATVVASNYVNLTASRAILQAFDAHFLV
jgi:hypothetical protein